jgi:hypothetical protein
MKMILSVQINPYNSKLENWEVRDQILENLRHVENALSLGLAACGVESSVCFSWQSFGELDNEPRPSISFED